MIKVFFFLTFKALKIFCRQAYCESISGNCSYALVGNYDTVKQLAVVEVAINRKKNMLKLLKSKIFYPTVDEI